MKSKLDIWLEEMQELQRKDSVTFLERDEFIKCLEDNPEIFTPVKAFRNLSGDLIIIRSLRPYVCIDGKCDLLPLEMYKEWE